LPNCTELQPILSICAFVTIPSLNASTIIELFNPNEQHRQQSRGHSMKIRTVVASVFAAAAVMGMSCALAQSANVMDTIAKTPNLSIATKLIKEAGLASTLSGAGPLTVFAPSDDAFKALPVNTFNELSTNKELLTSVLTYHVLPAEINSQSVANGSQKTANGASVAVYRSGTFLTIESALVTQADIKASNGVIDIVDTVLFPPKK
jgi:uncharacterized surface protein with fasciclin (FAS1) repeats